MDDASIAERLAKIIDARQRYTAASDHEKPSDRERRLAREAVLAELPRLIGRLSSAVAELNDTLADSGIRIDLEIAGHQPTHEGAFTLHVAGAAPHAPTLNLGVDWTGTVRAMLQEGSKRSLIGADPIFDMDKARITDLTLRLLEASYL